MVVNIREKILSYVVKEKVTENEMHVRENPFSPGARFARVSVDRAREVIDFNILQNNTNQILRGKIMHRSIPAASILLPPWVIAAYF